MLPNGLLEAIWEHILTRPLKCLQMSSWRASGTIFRPGLRNPPKWPPGQVLEPIFDQGSQMLENLTDSIILLPDFGHNFLISVHAAMAQVQGGAIIPHLPPFASSPIDFGHKLAKCVHAAIGPVQGVAIMAQQV